MGDVGLLEEVKKLTQSFGHDVPVLCRVDQGELALGVEAMRRGAYHVLPADEWSVNGWRQALALAPKRNDVNKSSPQKFVFVDANSQHLLELARRVAQTEVSALIVGPTGAGKEVLARVLHDASPRRNGPFVALNCAALPENLIEDLLFGHEKGAFTGALKEHRGLFEQAHGGTIFLDEIAEMPYHLQTKLLRVLQERKITRLGGQASVDLDVRLVAATNKDLREAIANREFREDLYFRISAFKLTILPLRQRPGDVLPLATQFLEKFGPTDRQMHFTQSAIDRMQQYGWPGNVRELQNVVQRALVLCNDDQITENELMFDEIDQRPDPLPVSTQSQLMHYGQRDISDAHQLRSEGLVDLSTAVKSSEYQVIMAAIQATKNRNEAAKKLGISPRSLRYKMAQFRERGMPAMAAA
jgi:two-component system response regulator FlrC